MRSFAGLRWHPLPASLPHPSSLAGLRILEVREAFCKHDFDWQLCQQLAAQQVRDGNLSLLRQHAARSFGGALGAPKAGEAPPDGGEPQ